MSLETNHERRSQISDQIAKFVATTNDLTNAEFMAVLGTIMSSRFDFRYDFKPVVSVMTDYLIWNKVDLDEVGNNIAGLLYCEPYTE